ncbi:hypothetical protein VT930_21680 [Mycobacterium sherrisii]|uniref:hypothetical protein n=1 Tax=Mycobacterium sherrisii TaxID=243061 RepID=UPI002DDDAEC7|nr:hypothetical protein [Mycobacterium sherrisii]MEC4765678.1 hypothetical protein [Mycobacterium sherrisii]
MMTATSQRPDVPLPAGIELAGEFDSDGYRDIFGVDRTIEDHQARVYALGSQNSEGAIVVGLVIVADGVSVAMKKYPLVAK